MSYMQTYMQLIKMVSIQIPEKLMAYIWWWSTHPARLQKINLKPDLYKNKKNIETIKQPKKEIQIMLSKIIFHNNSDVNG